MALLKLDPSGRFFRAFFPRKITFREIHRGKFRFHPVSSVSISAEFSVEKRYENIGSWSLPLGLLEEFLMRLSKKASYNGLLLFNPSFVFELK
jgi:hypothetical protein